MFLLDIPSYGTHQFFFFEPFTERVLTARYAS